MEKFLYKLLPVCFMLLVLAGCKDDITVIHQGEAQNLVASLNMPSAIYGDKLMFSVAVDDQQNAGLTLNENIDVILTFSGKDKNGKNVKAEDVFDGFAGHLAMKKGEKQGFAEFLVKTSFSEIEVPIEATITAYVRGYKINSAERPLTIADRYYTSTGLMNNEDKLVKEGNNFILQASLGGAAKENVKVFVDIDEENLAKLDPSTPVPEYLLILKGQTSAESSPIRVLDIVDNNVEELSVTIGFHAESTAHPLLASAEELTFTVQNLDAGMKEDLYEERKVYRNPDQIFISESNEGAVRSWDVARATDGRIMRVGDPHPTDNLASQGWKFMNSFEFHPIDALTMGGKQNQYGNRPPRYMGDHNVALVQKFCAVMNDKYTTMTDEGYLKVWCAKDPGAITTGGEGVAGQSRDYGTGALFAQKYDGDPRYADSWETSNVRILPGMRVEARVRISGNQYSFNPAVWFQGNVRGVSWPSYGEVDLLEAPCGNIGYGAWQTYHWGYALSSDMDGKEQLSKTSGMINILNGKTGSECYVESPWVIYWMEWLDDNTIVLGINGVEKCRLTKGERNPEYWPYSRDSNPEGMHLLITFAGNNSWALGKEESNWGRFIDNISYEQSKTDKRTPRVEIDWIRFYTRTGYQYTGQSTSPTRNKPMY